MPRASIITVDDKGARVCREVASASYDDGGFLYIHGKQAYEIDEIINMRSPAFCSVRFLHDSIEKSLDKIPSGVVLA
ncbi:hypothetical protein [Methanolobus profundi]|uniref:Uncharacterized protein n=1 Tax=Methanolobus profundi TaxID=487685 RepID=A0A1I4ULS3_9EURY|nr:hypothetical protein [Methanolobus profundi]SFM89916.1 hypothetical protein SAMN04488696_2780 [Methanolobus profundi]